VNNLSFGGIPMLAWIPLLPIIGAFINLTLGRRLSDRAIHTVGIASVLGAFAISVYMIAGTLYPIFKVWQGNPVGPVEIKQLAYTWIEVGSFKVELAFRLDTLSAVMILIITFVGTLIHIYSTGYMHGEKRYAAYFGYLNLFMGAMLILVLGANIPVMFIGWEGVGLCSFLLIGFWFEKTEYANAGRKAFVVNRIGDFAFLIGMFLLYWAVKDKGFAQSLDFGDLRSPVAGVEFAKTFETALFNDRLAAFAGIMMFIGACGKSAQIPLYVWLPDAMAGPTPVSALIHAATMVTAGVYMICRLSFLYSYSTTALGVVAVIGLLTALAAAFMAFAQTDLKKVLAYSTVSQLGFMFVAVGTGNWVAAIFHLGTHAFFKAGLFLGAGSVMHGMGGSGDITIMGGLRKHMPITRFVFLIYCLAIAGVPLLSGFFSKDEILAGAWFAHPPDWPSWCGKALWFGLTIAALGTAFYMWRLYFMVFSGEERSDTARKAHESPTSMTAPLVILALLAAFAGVIGLPHLEALHGLPKFTHFLADWLHPSLTHDWYNGVDANKVAKFLPIEGHHSDGAVIALMACASLVGLLGIGIAWMLYGRGPSPTVKRWVAGPLAGVQDLSKNKLFVDEAYEVAIVKPFRALARGTFEIVDRFVVDTVAVNGSAFGIGLLSRLSRWFQNGQVQRYLFGLVIGAGAVFAVTDCRHHTGLSYRQVGESIELRAEVGSGISGNNAQITWDINGDGVVDTIPGANENQSAAVITVPAGDVGSKVTAWIVDPVSRKTITVTRDIRLSQLVQAPAPADQGGK
jgi:NADH-quinone oxidoreductase subunit L